MLTLAFWKGLAERAIKTFAQSLVAVIGTGALGILAVDWRSALSVAALATVVSVLTSIANTDFTAGVPIDLRESGGVPQTYVIPTAAAVPGIGETAEAKTDAATKATSLPYTATPLDQIDTSKTGD